MDLMGHMQVESLGGRIYVFILVDNYSKLTWVNFFRENSNTSATFERLRQQLQRKTGNKIGKVFYNIK